MDWQTIDTQIRMEQAIASGELVGVFIHPISLGGVDATPNFIGIPVSAVENYDRIEKEMNDVISDCTNGKLYVDVDYIGKSYVPTRLNYWIIENDTIIYRNAIDVY